jgi:hypothetical protein
VQSLISDDGSSTNSNISLALPDTPDVPGALAQLYGLAESNGVAVQTISVSVPAVQIDSGSEDDASSTALMPTGSVTFQIAGAGSYESLQNFLSGLETNVRLFDLKGINITSEGQVSKNSTSSQDFFNYTISVAAYYQTH